MTDEELTARLRGCATWFDDIAAADRIEQLVATNEALVKERDEAWKRAAHAEKMWGEAEVRAERLEARLGEYNLLWQVYEGDLYQAYVNANEARIDAEAKLRMIDAEARAALKGGDHE